MLLKRETLDRIRAGEVTVAFRKWRRPTVKASGTLRTQIGVLRIEAVEPISGDDITDLDAAQAGYADAGAVREAIALRSEGQLYRIRFHLEGPDPRLELREQTEISEEEWSKLEVRLGRLDRASHVGAWTRATLEVIEGDEGVRAGDLAPMVGQERQGFKLNVRKLKNLGLTVSLGTGYRLSPRGREVLGKLRVEGS